MEKIKLEYQTILFLYAYLRQADLSIDRSRWTSLEKLRVFYSNKIKPHEVLKAVMKNYNLDYTTIVQSKTLVYKKNNNLFKLKTIKISIDELNYLCNLLQRFKLILSSNLLNFDSTIENLRYDIASFYTYILSNKVSKRDIAKLMKIEHYNQTILEEMISIDHVIPKNFFRN